MKKEVFVTFHITPFLLLLCLFFIMQIPKVGEKFTFVRLRNDVSCRSTQSEKYLGTVTKILSFRQNMAFNSFLQTSVFYFSHFQAKQRKLLHLNSRHQYLLSYVYEQFHLYSKHEKPIIIPIIRIMQLYYLLSCHQKEFKQSY